MASSSRESEPNAPQYDVFLSHRRADSSIVEQIASRLVDEVGLRPFFDKWDLVPGTTLSEALEDALARSACCAFFVGASGVAGWENEEVRAVLERRIKAGTGVRIIPVLLPGANDKDLDSLPPFLRRFLAVDFTGGLESSAAFGRLVAGITGRPPGRSQNQALSDRSLFVLNSTEELFRRFLDSRFSLSRLDTTATLEAQARLAHLHVPNVPFGEVLDSFRDARSRVYDHKYADRPEADDERYLDFPAWESELLDMVRRCVQKPITELDVVNVGIGNGNECPAFYADVKRLVAVDVSGRSLQLARERLPHVVTVQTEAETLSGLTSSSFDLYMSLRTFQSSFFDIERAALEAARVLAPEGAALISVPNVYVERGNIATGLQRSGSATLDPHLPWIVIDRIRRAFFSAEFSCSIFTGLYEIYLTATR